jgi:transposase InsO family protein
MYQHRGNLNLCQFQKGFGSVSPWTSYVDCQEVKEEIIMVIIDKLTKYCHLIFLTHPFSAATVAEKFLEIVHKLHGLPVKIIIDRDPIFTSNFWKELMQKLGVKLNFSTVYHPQIDGKTEKLN